MFFAPGRKILLSATALALAVSVGQFATPPAEAQFSNRYNFMNAVRNRDFTEAQAVLEQPGLTIIDTRDPSTGETALHLVTRRRDTQWLLFLLRERANPNVRDRDGNTPMHIAAQIGYPDGIRWLDVVNANVNAANNRGETPLVLAVQQRNADIVRQLVEAGADPDIADGVVGMSARDYAARDTRGQTILQILDSAQDQDETAPAVGPTFD